MLTVLWVLPLVGGLAVLACGRASPRAPRRAALAFAAAALGYSAWLGSAASASEGWRLAEGGAEWLFGIRYDLALDGLSLPLCWLTGYLTVIALVSSWRQDLPAGYWAAFLFLESALFGVFLARDLFVFYVFWEAVLIPMFFIIGLWGSEGRRHAAMKFFLFTFFGSLFLLIGLLTLVTRHHAATGVWTWDVGALGAGNGAGASLGVFACLVVGFGVKVPMVPLHTWLADAHTEAPAAGSVMLAGVLLKMGVYGFLRVLLPLFGPMAWDLLPWLGLAAGVNIIHGSLCAMAQSDLKRLVAFSSIAHLGFCLLGIFSRTPEGLAGGSLQMINHGLTAAALFMMVGFLYERSHRRGIADFGGLVARAPRLTFFFGVAVMASIGVPGLNGFVGEFMALCGVVRVLPILAAAGVAGVALSAAYSLPAYQDVFWGEAGAGSAGAQVSDLDLREEGLLWALVLPMIFLGLYPNPLLSLMQPALAGLLP